MAEKCETKEAAGLSVDPIDCAVCLQPCVHATVLPCGHIFCYLCVKGLGRTTRTCAMCRQEFPVELLENPSLLHPIDESLAAGFEDGHQWFYEGRNGWWQYDARTSRDIEDAFKKGEETCEVSIAGKVYVVDFNEMEQKQKQNSLRSRRIKRDLVTIPKKGISGIRPPSTNDELETRMASLNLLNRNEE